MNPVTAPPDSAVEAAFAAAAQAITFTTVKPGKLSKGADLIAHIAPDDDPSFVLAPLSGTCTGTLMVAAGDEFLERLLYTSKVEEPTEAVGPIIDALVGSLRDLGAIDLGPFEDAPEDSWPGEGEHIISVPLMDGKDVAMVVALAVTYNPMVVEDPVDAGGDASGQPEPSETSSPEAGASPRLPDTRVANAESAAQRALRKHVARLAMVEVEVSGVLGDAHVALHDLLAWLPGSIILLQRSASEPADLRVDETTLAHGEVVVIDEHYGLRVLDVIASAVADSIEVSPS